MATLISSQNEYWRTLLSAQTYKPQLGQYARYGTLGAFLLLIGLGVYSWSQLFTSENGAMKWGLPVAIGALSAWIAFRTIHYPRFAEFLIATESEMAKVKWPSRQELRAATAVILMNVVILTLFLFVTDIVWRMALWSVGVLQVPQLFGNAAGM